MTPPPALLVAPAPPGPASGGVAVAGSAALVRARRQRPAVRVRPDWTCDNCDTPNAGRRRRCTDCGTSCL